MIKVIVTGSECTGKTTLARALAAIYGAPVSAEYCREFVERSGAQPNARDVEEIARGQLVAEDQAIKRADDLVILDTDLLSTLVYSRHYYGECPDWIDDAVSRRAGDLYLLAGIDVPWRADGLQRDRGDVRVEMQDLFRTELLCRNLDFIELRGSHEERLRAARGAIDSVSRQGRDHPNG
jgi:NadR type nicotinamide-nucleotide adenylyltransferase